MIILKGFLGAVVPLFLFSSGLLAEQKISPADAVKIKIFTSHDVVETGGEFKVGVLFELADGWHIYWKNPGESGLPTSINLSSESEVFKFGEVNWPIPSRFMQPGAILGYGYNNQALFEIPVQIVGDKKRGTFKLAVDLRWLLCSKSVCIPGRDNGLVNVELGSTARSSKDSKLFDRSAVIYPEIIRKPYPPTVTVSHRDLSADEHDKLYQLKVEWASDPGEIELFLASDRQVSMELVEVQTGTRATEVNLRVQIKDSERVSQREIEILLVPASESKERPLSVRLWGE